MKILNRLTFNHKDSDCTFIKIDPEDLSITIKNILSSISNLSWLSKISETSLQKAFFENANKTIVAIKSKFDDAADDSAIKNSCGEYIVSTLSKEILVTELKHSDIPLMELLGLKTTNNPGFDFYTEENEMILFCGEAKFINGINAHSSSMKQLNDFIDNKKHISDLVLIRDFVSEQTKNNTVSNIVGATAAFSCKTHVSDTDLVETIKQNPHFEEMSKRFKTLIFVGVEFK